MGLGDTEGNHTKEIEMTTAELTQSFDRWLVRGLLFCAACFVAGLVAFTSSCCGRIILP